ncbi:MAG: recombinase family protein, partial [Marinomonas sp.]
QETRCREFAKYMGYEVVEVFQDDASGGLIDRPGIQSMLRYIRKRKKDPYVVIIDDVSRLARGLDAHLALRTAISDAGETLKSPSIEFGEDSDSILVENMLASVSQHQRQKNAKQTKNRMRARVMNGYCVLGRPPKGLEYEQTPIYRKLLVRDEPIASIIQEAMEGFACGRFQTQVEVKRFLESQPDYPKDLLDGTIRQQRVRDMLTQPLYAGYVEAPKWGVSLRKGHHEGLISFETFQRIQERLNETAKTPARKDISLDFPLRGFVLCDDCDKPMTACWSKSGTGDKHPYYVCYTKGCQSYRKSIRRADLEGDFEAILKDLQPIQHIFKAAKQVFLRLWDRRAATMKERAKAYQEQAQTAQKQIEKLLDRIMGVESDAVISAYEARVAKLEQEKLLAEERAAQIEQPREAREDLFELRI